MNLKKLFPLALLAMLLLSACAAQQPEAVHKAAQPTVPEPNVAKNIDENEAKGDIEAEQEQDMEAEAEAELNDSEGNDGEPGAGDDEPPAPEAPEILYYMTEHYLIRPLDEEGDRNVVLLTFDDGPKDREMVESMLNTLDKFSAKAIFFVNGYRVEQNPELLVAIHERGHAIGNHSWDHILLREQTPETIDQQIDDVQAIVEKLTGETPRFFRPPFGAGNDYVRQKVREENMLFMNWSNGSEDWEAHNQEADKVIERVMEQLHPGSNILMHELPWTVEALDRLLEQILEQGYSFVDPQAIQTDHEA